MQDPNETVFGSSYGKYANIIEPLLTAHGCEKITKKGSEISCCCPFHEETKPSFGINLDTGVFNCFSCEAKGSITDFVAQMKGITNQEAWKEVKEIMGEEINSSENYTLEDYAKEKNLSVEFLKRVNIQTANEGKNVAIPYYDETGTKLVRVRYRNHPNNPTRFFWDKNGTGTTLYGLWLLNSYKRDYLCLVEGESDCHAAWTNGIQCIGVPGAKNFSSRYAPYFEKFDKIYIHSEEDSGAKTFISGISEVLPTNKLYIVNSKAIDSNCKDLADLNIYGKLNLQALLSTAVKFEPNLDYLGNIGFQAFLKMLESGKLEFANNVESLELLENYKRINNTILGFLKDEESIELFGTDIKTTEMWRKYKSFCGDNRLEPLPKLQFYEQLVKQFGFVKKLNTGTYYFYRQAPLDDSEFSEVDIEKF